MFCYVDTTIGIDKCLWDLLYRILFSDKSPLFYAGTHPSASYDKHSVQGKIHLYKMNIQYTYIFACIKEAEHFPRENPVYMCTIPY